jgi:RNA polymerase-binding transcription factor DksA
MPDRFHQPFKSEAEYSDFLAEYLKKKFGVIVSREVGKGCVKSGLGGIVDIYIPIVKAVIECKKDTKNKEKAFKQLTRYGIVFNTELLFFAASDDPETAKSLISALEPIIEDRKAFLVRELNKTLKSLSEEKYSIDKDFPEITHDRISESTNRLLSEAREVISHSLDIQIRKQLRRLENEWFKYCYTKGWYKPLCSINPFLYGECWQHPSDKNTWIVETRPNSFYDCTGVAFYDVRLNKVYFEDNCGRGRTSERFKERKKSCQGMPCSFDNGFSITSEGIFLSAQTRELSTLALNEEALFLAFLLHPDTKGYEEYLRAEKQYLYCNVKDYLRNETIGEFLTNLSPERIVYYSQVHQYLPYITKNNSTASLIKKLLGEALFEKYFSGNKIKIAAKIGRVLIV